MSDFPKRLNARYSLANFWASLDSQPHFWLAMILIASLSLRLIALNVSSAPVADGRWYRIARNVVGGKGFVDCISSYFPYCGPGNDQTATSGPVPVLLFAILLKVFGVNWLSVMIGLHYCLGLLTMVLIYATTQILFKQARAALGAALLWGTYFPMISLERFVTAEPLATFLITAGLYVALRGIRSPNGWWWVLAGICLGLTALSRSAFVYFPFVLLLVMVWLHPLSRQGRVLISTVFLGTFLVVLSPWVIRNALTFKEFLPGISLNGYNLYRNHFILETDDYLRVTSADETKIAVNKLLQQTSGLRGIENEAQLDQIYQTAAIDIIKQHPVRYALLSAYRIIPFLTDFGVYEEPQSIFWKLSGLENSILLGLSVLGFFLHSYKKSGEMVAILTLLIYYFAGHLLVDSQMRYLVPIMPFITILASSQIVRMTLGT